MRSIRSSGWGIVSFCMPGAWEIDHPERKKLQIPGATPREGGMVTGQDEHPAKTDS